LQQAELSPFKVLCKGNGWDYFPVIWRAPQLDRKLWVENADSVYHLLEAGIRRGEIQPGLH
jgi:hypothetical protein